MKPFPTQNQSRKNHWQTFFEMFLLRPTHHLRRSMIQRRFNRARKSRRSRARLVSCRALDVMVLVLSHLLNPSPAVTIHVGQFQGQRHRNSLHIHQSLFNSQAAVVRDPLMNHPMEATTSPKLIPLGTRLLRSRISLERPFTPTREQTTWQAFFEIANLRVRCRRNHKPLPLLYKRKNQTPSNECSEGRRSIRL